jgi:hypothetical protein
MTALDHDNAPPPENLSEQTLESMLRGSWTPTLVKTLVRRYLDLQKAHEALQAASSAAVEAPPPVRRTAVTWTEEDYATAAKAIAVRTQKQAGTPHVSRFMEKDARAALDAVVHRLPACGEPNGLGGLSTMREAHARAHEDLADPVTFRSVFIRRIDEHGLHYATMVVLQLEAALAPLAQAGNDYRLFGQYHWVVAEKTSHDLQETIPVPLSYQALIFAAQVGVSALTGKIAP